jgi:hypothetical protein
MKRSSWLNFLADSPEDERALTPKVRQALAKLDEKLFEIWNLGDNIILVWTHAGSECRFLAVRHYAIIESFGAVPNAAEGGDPNAFVNRILSGSKFVAPPRFDSICAVLGAAAQVTALRFAPGEEPATDLITRLVTRYGVSLVRERAVVLLDAVGFSLRSPLEQVAMLDSLSYSVNSAYRQLLSKDVRINFARTTTGDGFYIWNRARTMQANIALYKLMMLTLTDNAMAQRKAKRFPVPKLRAAFHIGEHYEFYQVEALNPTTFAYIVGQVTIDLSRMIERSLPGQILIGDFNIELHDAKADRLARYGTLDFVERTTATLDELKGLTVAQDRIENVRCYLTGAGGGGNFRVDSYRIADKHGLTRRVYNAKINIHRAQAEPVFLGIQHRELHPDGGGSAWLPSEA